MSRINKLFTPLLQLPRWQKRVVSVSVDVFALIVLSVFSLNLRFGELYWPSAEQWLSISLLPLLAIPLFIRLGLYRSVIRYISIRFVYTVLAAVSIAFVAWTAVLFMLDLSFPRSGIVISWLMVLMFIAGSRVIARTLLSNELNPVNAHIKSRVVIYGAGNGAQQLFNALLKVLSIKVVAFIDDCPQLQGQIINGIKIHKPSDLDSLIESHSITDVFLAIPSLPPSKKKAVLKWLEPKHIKVSIVPPIDKIVGGEIQYSDVREVEIEDLLGRDKVLPKPELLSHCIADKVVMVSGAGGSIGSELCRQISQLKPKLLILFDMSEFALYQIDKDLQDSKCETLSFLGSVQDKVKLDKLMKKYQVETVYHAAAYKHVPLVEHNIGEGIKNNSFGTLTIAKSAAKNKVKNFVLVSTDKAVRPTNFMGASKRMAELALQALQQNYKETCFVMVRFGNVLGSSGSVIPLFKEQIKRGGPVTVTHPDITRYFMTIPEAASLVIQAGSMGQGGDVFVLDMGEPVKIIDLAKRIIHLSGFSVVDESGDGDISIKFTGLRPGEKLYEELLIGDDVNGTGHPKIMKANEYAMDIVQLENTFKQIELALDNQNFEKLSELVGSVVKGFNHQSGIVDHLSN